MVDYPAEVVSLLVSVGEDCISELVVRDERERVSPLPCHVTIEFEERPVLERLEPTCHRVQRRAVNRLAERF